MELEKLKQQNIDNEKQDDMKQLIKKQSPSLYKRYSLLIKEMSKISTKLLSLTKEYSEIYLKIKRIENEDK